MQTGIYVGNQTQLDILEEAINATKDTESDIFMFTDDILARGIPILDLACINMAHMTHYYEKILFLNHKDFNDKAKKLNGIIGVICEKENLIRLDSELIKTKNVSILVKDNNGLREVKNAELQSITR